MPLIESAIAFIGLWLAEGILALTSLALETLEIIGGLLYFLATNPVVLLTTIGIAAVTISAIAGIMAIYQSIQEAHQDVHVSKDKEEFEQELNKHKGEECIIENKLWHFDRETDRYVNEIIEEKEPNERKKNALYIFVSRCFQFVSKALEGQGAVTENESFDSYNKVDKITASLRYDLNTRTLKLIFVFTGREEFFEFIRVLLETLKKKGLKIDMNKYEREFQNFEFDEDDINKYTLKI